MTEELDQYVRFTKEWYKTDEGREYQREKRAKFMEKHKDYSREKIQCVCGLWHTRSNTTHHRKTNKHFEALAKKNS